MILMSHIPNLGMARDRQQRSTLKRSDNIHRQAKVNSARKLIYEQNYTVGSTAVEKLLKDESLVPTSVYSKYIHVLYIVLTLI